MRLDQLASLIVAAAVGLFLSASSARAEEKVLHCSASGFTGYLKLTYSGSTPRKNVRLYYRITKGGNSGGNKANVYVNDNGIAPTLKLSNHDDGIQDGKWHAYYGPYNRGYGGFTVQFVFDRSKASDPRCSVSPRI